MKTKHKMSIHFVGRIEVESKGKGERNVAINNLHMMVFNELPVYLFFLFLRSPDPSGSSSLQLNFHFNALLYITNTQTGLSLLWGS